MLLKKYEHIFFDLDHTLWDYDKAMAETLHEMYIHFDLGNKGVQRLEDLVKVYRRLDFECWQLFLENKISKTEMRKMRYLHTLKHFGIENEELAAALMKYFMETCPRKGYAMPGAIELLNRLFKSYSLHIITNGLKDIQHYKISNTGMLPFLKQIIVSDEAGYYKPDKRVFEYALHKAGARIDNSLMIGDSLYADVLGARNAGIDQVYFNRYGDKHNERVSLEIKDLTELNEWL